LADQAATAGSSLRPRNFDYLGGDADQFMFKRKRAHGGRQMNTPEQLRDEISRLTREYSKLSHGRCRRHSPIRKFPALPIKTVQIVRTSLTPVRRFR
jgi:hypothetical protein